MGNKNITQAERKYIDYGVKLKFTEKGKARENHILKLRYKNKLLLGEIRILYGLSHGSILDVFRRARKKYLKRKLKIECIESIFKEALNA